ncbi:Thymidylate synthase [termite gut metagenome]|uniref:Thymidylate synthase n=1 Tax=termite gut metagenome TaxID=433724 RepID=A0A5J4QLK4_9ZZZZ
MNDFDFYKKDANTLVCNKISDCYVDLNNYIKEEGIIKDSRIGKTFEVLNFKTVIKQPLSRCLVAQNRNANIFFHLAESLWIFSGRNDLEFINLFNSRFKEYSDDGISLHGAYGERLRFWKTLNGESFLDQLFLNTAMLAKDPNTRRSVFSLWNPLLDLENQSRDIPCNIQLAIKIHENDLYLTIFNRSNDLHWGFVADIFQFSFMGEIIALLLNKNFIAQTHLSQSLHIYQNNELISSIEQTNIHCSFFSKYKPSPFLFTFENSISNFSERFNEIDMIFKDLNNSIIQKSRETTRIELDDILSFSIQYKNKSQSVFEIAFLLFLSLSFKKSMEVTINKDNLRCEYADFLIHVWKIHRFVHADYHALALNYFVRRISYQSLKLKYIEKDSNIGQY